MYERILIPLEHSAADDTILAHVRPLARLCKSELVLIHVADGWAARNQEQLNLRESEEMRADREYIERVCSELEGEGFPCDAVLARRRTCSMMCSSVGECSRATRTRRYISRSPGGRSARAARR